LTYEIPFHPPQLPPPVVPGDRIGVAALSGWVDADALSRGLAALVDLGFEPVPAANLGCRHDLFAGSDRERLEGFHRLAADPTIKAVIFARGGHGVLRVLSGIDWELLRCHPRTYVGYSDLVPFLLELTRRLGWVSFHGPMVATDLGRGLGAEEARSLLDALAGLYPVELPIAGSAGWSEGQEAVEGPLAGGCLSLLAALQGTPFAPAFDGSLVFWEEVREPRYRVDRMLTHLKLSSSLTHARAMIVGHVLGPAGAGAPPTPTQPAHEAGGDGESLWRGSVEELSRELGWPYAWGVGSGHGVPNLTLPLGLWTRLEAATGRLVLGAPSPSRIDPA
jgi:muramoyltetrapeptide carboxypeptidase